MKNPADMTDKEIRAEIFSDEASPARERVLAEELAKRGSLKKTSRQVDVNENNEER